MYNHTLYFAYWFVNSAVLFFSTFLLPDSAVQLGSWRFTSLEASIYTGFWLTFLYWVWWDFEIYRKLKSDIRIVSFFVYVIVNSTAVWIVSVFGDTPGFKLNSYYPWLIILGFTITMVQSLIWKIVTKN